MTSERDDVISAIGQLRAVLDRVGLLFHGVGGSWIEQLPAAVSGDEARARDAVAMLRGLTEHVRWARTATAHMDDMHPINVRDDRTGPHLGNGLPINRKERYYTGTVLPMIVAEFGFTNLDRFLSRCGLPSDIVVDAWGSLDGHQPLQFFTEYSFAESVFAAAHKRRFADRPRDADTPDLVLLGADWLLAVEAKMFHRPTREALHGQMARQRRLVEYWTAHFALPPSRVRHVLLLPARLAEDRPRLDYPVVTWEQVLADYQGVASGYWWGALSAALASYEELRSEEPPRRANADAMLSGEQIKQMHEGGDCRYLWMGRQGGRHGKALAEDIKSGRWREQSYEVREHELPENPNWFAVSEFLAQLPISQSS